MFLSWVGRQFQMLAAERLKGLLPIAVRLAEETDRLIEADYLRALEGVATCRRADRY